MAERAVMHQSPREHGRREPAVILADHEHALPIVRQAFERARLLERLGERLLDQDVQAGLERLARDRRMRRKGHDHERRVGPDLLQRVLQGAEHPLAGQAEIDYCALPRGRVEVDPGHGLDALRVPGDLLDPVPPPAAEPDLHQS